MTANPLGADDQARRAKVVFAAFHRSRVHRRPMKRALDLLVAGLALLLVAPLLLLAYVLVRVSSPGPGLFRQSRIGHNGKPFDILKFRTMYVDCDEDRHREYVRQLLAGQARPQNGLYKLDGDERITRVGAILRRTSVDELPQLVNVVRGEMSLVGPRPALPWECAMFPAWAAPRYWVRPGVTGLWQVSGRNRLTMLEGLQLDVEYVARQRLLLDLMILLRTVPTVLAAGGR
jgi:lipopolysaccharide/colanic/teichoic acid biosynthesis glycosyltransferase